MIPRSYLRLSLSVYYIFALKIIDKKETNQKKCEIEEREKEKLKVEGSSFQGSLKISLLSVSRSKMPFEEKEDKRKAFYQAVTKDLSSSSKFSGSCVLTLQTLLSLFPSSVLTSLIQNHFSFIFSFSRFSFHNLFNLENLPAKPKDSQVSFVFIMAVHITLVSFHGQEPSFFPFFSLDGSLERNILKKLSSLRTSLDKEIEE